MKYHLVIEPFILNNSQYIKGQYISTELIEQNPDLAELVSVDTYDLILG